MSVQERLKGKYPEHVIRAVRKNLGIEGDDSSMDKEILEMDRDEVFDRFVTWNNHPGWGDTLRTWYRDIYGYPESVMEQANPLYADVLRELSYYHSLYTETAAELVSLIRSAQADDPVLFSTIEQYANAVYRWNRADPCGGLEEELSEKVASLERKIRAYCESKTS